MNLAADLWRRLFGDGPGSRGHELASLQLIKRQSANARDAALAELQAALIGLRPERDLETLADALAGTAARNECERR